MARAGQRGYHHRIEMNKKVYKIGKAREETHKVAILVPCESLVGSTI